MGKDFLLEYATGKNKKVNLIAEKAKINRELLEEYRKKELILDAERHHLRTKWLKNVLNFLLETYSYSEILDALNELDENYDD